MKQTQNGHYYFLFSYISLFTIKNQMVKILQMLPNWSKNQYDNDLDKILINVFIKTIYK